MLTDAFSSYQGMQGRTHLPKTVGVMAAHVLLPWIHRVFANLKRLALGVYHGFRRAHLQAYLDEFVFRWNRRRHLRRDNQDENPATIRMRMRRRGGDEGRA